tara:strand:+ start:58 stop:675 length:618 start_codon:yes stop_codon:yes gene_type:complete
MNHKVFLFLFLFLFSFSGHAQTVVRKDGLATGTDGQVKDLGMSKGFYLDLQEWRIGVQVPIVVLQEYTQRYDYDSYLAYVPHLTVEKCTNMPWIRWKGAVGFSRGDATGEFSQTGAYLAGGIRLDASRGDFFFYQQTRSFELMAETILDVDPKYMLTLNAYQSVELFDAATFDFVFGVGLASVTGWEEPALQIRLGVGVGFGGVR